MTHSQQFIPITDVQDGLIYLKDGSVSLILSTSAVNFGLLFETEQIAIIEAFARLLNSLSFPIQIVTHSKRLDVSSYLKTLDQAYAKQTNPRLKAMTLHFRKFVESIIKENNVLDKQFYLCLNVSSMELGVLPKTLQEKTLKAMTILVPRRDHLIGQLSRLGLKARQMNSAETAKLFYEAYNPLSNGASETMPKSQNQQVAVQAQPKQAVKITRLPISPDVYRSPLQPQQAMVQAPVVKPTLTVNPTTGATLSTTTRLAPPFIVEELPDDFGP